MKSDLLLSQYEYKSIQAGRTCPCCGSKNTYFSCYNSSWTCFDCDEIFDIAPAILATEQGEIVPLPCGTLYPSLAGSYNYNSGSTPDWLTILCPNCNSDNVCYLSPVFNPELDSYGRWFCISCYDSWEYGRER